MEIGRLLWREIGHSSNFCRS